MRVRFAEAPKQEEVVLNNGPASLRKPVKEANSPTRLRLLTYNIQAGIAIKRYRQYVTHSWKHIFPYPKRTKNLDSIAELVSHYDIVGLQEVDGGSLRSGFVNQVEYLAHKAGFPYWYYRTNRNLGKFGQHSIGLLSRLRTASVDGHKLPGLIPGRGAMVLRFGEGDDTVTLVIAHLALGQRTRVRQLAYLSRLINGHRHVILMGDFNCGADSKEMDLLMYSTSLHPPIQGLYTFPSWRPYRNIDHILVSPSLRIERAGVLDYALSDHLPVCMEVSLPEGMTLVSR